MREAGAVDFSRLKHVRVSRVGQRSLRHFPTFLIIGPQRTGTTWLGKMLWRHPQVMMSFPKEIYFFNLLNQPNHRYYRSNQLRWYLRRFRDDPVSYAVKMTRSLTKYRAPYRPIARGEATASYAAMDSEIIADVVALKPDVKAIVMIRDPVARAWSHAKKDLLIAKNRRISEVSDEEFQDFFSDPYQVACGTYSNILRNWSQALLPGNLFVGRFEEIATDPGGLLRRLLSFIGVADDLKYVAEYLHVRVNPTEDADLPDRHREFLQRQFSEETRRLAAGPLTR
jgi:hypothetical protein